MKFVWKSTQSSLALSPADTGNVSDVYERRRRGVVVRLTRESTSAVVIYMIEKLQTAGCGPGTRL